MAKEEIAVRVMTFTLTRSALNAECGESNFESMGHVIEWRHSSVVSVVWETVCMSLSSLG